MVAAKNPSTSTMPDWDRSEPAARSVGFPRSQSELPPNVKGICLPAGTISMQVASSANKPAVHRRKGRWFVSTIILSIICFILVTLWNEFVHYQAFGIIEGRVIRIASAGAGLVKEVCVDEGDMVSAGQLLARIENYQLRREREQLICDLQIARASLESRMAEISVTRRQSLADSANLEAEYHQLLGQLHNRQSKSRQLKQIHDTLHELQSTKAVSESEFISAKADFEGNRAEIEELEKACEKLGVVLERIKPVDDDTRLAAELATLKALQAQIARHDELTKSLEVRAPVDGKIVRRHFLVGEHTTPEEPLFELLESGSLSAVIYLHQDRADLLTIGEQIGLVVPPLRERQHFVVKRIGDHVEGPPTTLIRFYRAQEALVPVYAYPVDLSKHLDSRTTWIGATVSLPRFGFREKVPQRDTRSIAANATAD